MRREDPSAAGRVRIFSDLHLGHKLGRITEVAALRPLVDGCATVVFNGDTWQELAREFRPRAAGQLDELRELCADAGAEAVFLSGNHDPGWPGDGWIELAGGALVATHGDALFPAGSPWKREIIRKPGRIEALWAAHPAAGHDAAERIRLARAIASELRSVEHPGGRSFVRRVWDALVPPQRAWHMLDAWVRQATAGAEFCDGYFPAARALVIGHFHCAGCWRRGGRLVINTGSFMSPGPAAHVDWCPADGWLSWALIDERDPRAFRSRGPLGVWRLDGGATVPTAGMPRR